MKTFLKSIVSLIILTSGLNALATVTLPWYEPFPSSYTEGERIRGTTTATVWNVGNSAGADSVTNTINAALSYGTLVTTAGSRGALFTTNLPSSGRIAGAGFTSQTPGAGNQVFYASFLLSITASPTGNRIVCSLDSATGSSPNGSVGCWVNTLNQIALGKASTTVPNVTNATPLVTNTVHLVVLKYKWISATAGDDVVSLYLDPVPGDPEPGSATLTTASGGDASSLSTFYLIQGSASAPLKSGGYLLDEIRVSTNWADVVPSAGCNSAVVTTNPVSTTNNLGATASFNISASGTAATFQWQSSTNSGTDWTNILGATAASYTTPALTGTDNGSQFRCIVSVACNSSSATSTVAQVTVLDPTGKFFRSAASGSWNSFATWEMSTDNSTWVPANVTPSSLATNINIRNGHTVTVTNAVTADDLTIEAGGELDADGATLTINNGDKAVDCDVSGILKVANVAGSALVTTGAGIQFNAGSTFKWSLAVAPAVPAATWADGSTCRIEATSASAVFATGISGQSFYDLTFDTTAGGQSQRCRFDIQGIATTVRQNLSISIPDTANASVTLCNGTNVTLTVGGNVTFVTGATANTTKVLLNNSGGDIFLFKVAGNFSATGFLDGFGASATTLEFNGSGTQSLTVPDTTANFITSSAVSYLVDPGANVVLGAKIPGSGGATVGAGGTLNIGTYKINGNAAGTLSLNATATVIGSGTNQITSGFGTNNFGGTLNLGILPPFVGGENFVLFGGGASYSGAFTIIPATPGGGFSWDTGQLLVTGTLAVSGGTPASPGNIAGVVANGGNVILSITNGTANTAFSVIGTNNLAAPRATWPVVGTGNFNGFGAANFTNAIGSGNMFYEIRVP